MTDEASADADKARRIRLDPWFPNPPRRKDRRLADGSLVAAPRDKRAFGAGIAWFLLFGSFVAFFIGAIATAPVWVDVSELGTFERVVASFGALGFTIAVLWAASNCVAGAVLFVARLRTLLSGSTVSAWRMRLAHGVLALGAAGALVLVLREAGRILHGVYTDPALDGPSMSMLTTLAAGWSILLSFALLVVLAGELVGVFSVRRLPVPGPLRLRETAQAGARIAHWSDLHLTAADDVPTIEAKPGVPVSGNRPLRQLIAEHHEVLRDAHMILITGDVTDAGTGEEWRAFFDLVPPAWLERSVIVPGNHDLNMVDASVWKTSTARSGGVGTLGALFASGDEGEEQLGRKLRAVRLIAALDRVQGGRTSVLGPEGALVPLADVLDACAGELEEFVTRPPLRTFEDSAVGLRETTSPRDRGLLELPHRLMDGIFPCVVTVPGTPLRVVVLDSNIASDNTATNAMGMIGAPGLLKLRMILKRLDDQGEPCLIALHHHVALPRRVGERLIERMQARFMACEDAAELVGALDGKRERVVLHGHRHVKYEASLGERIHLVSAPSTTLGNEWAPRSASGSTTSAFTLVEVGWSGAGVSVRSLREYRGGAGA